MEELSALISAIVDRVAANLKSMDVNVTKHLKDILPLEYFGEGCAYYGLTQKRPLLHFMHSALRGSHFLGRCAVENSVLYECGIRGDELKSEGDVFSCCGLPIALYDDERILVKNSYLIKTLVNGHSCDPQRLDEYRIKDSICLHHAGIHGSTIHGSLLGPFSTVRNTALTKCVLGPYTYVETGSLRHAHIGAGHILIREDGVFEFEYQLPEKTIQQYVQLETGKPVEGIFLDFEEKRSGCLYDKLDRGFIDSPAHKTQASFRSRYSSMRGICSTAEDTSVAHGTLIADTRLGRNSRILENCHVLGSDIGESCTAAAGVNIIHTRLGDRATIGARSFLRGRLGSPLIIGRDCIVMPHTVIDPSEPVEDPPGRLIWGYIQNAGDLSEHSLPIDSLSGEGHAIEIGKMCFRGSGPDFLAALRNRTPEFTFAENRISSKRCSFLPPQSYQDISFNVIQPYPQGRMRGMYPTVRIST